MKKILVLILTTVVATQFLKAQYDTLFVGMREPTFYYWDTNFFDHYALKPSVNPERYPENYFSGAVISTDQCAPEMARYLYTDTTLRVIGIAIVGGLYHVSNAVDTVMAHQLPEYFNLYEVDGDSMILIKSVQWNSPDANVVQKYYMQCDYYKRVAYVPNHGYDTVDGSVYGKVTEAYFDSPVYVNDSFYASVTFNNNYKVCIKWETDDTLYGHLIHVRELSAHHRTVFGLCHSMMAYPDTVLSPHPQHFKYRLTHIDDYNYWSPVPVDTLDCYWHTAVDKNFRCFYHVFPIIDTGYCASCPPPADSDACQVPQGLRVMDVSDGVVTLTWNNAAVDHWELSLASKDSTSTPPTVTWHTQTFASVELKWGEWYVARLRAVCDSLRESEWSDTIEFYVPLDSPPTTEVSSESLLDNLTYLRPNPTKGKVSIASSFGVRNVEVFTLDGQMVMSQTVNALSTELNIESLPKGAYVVRITTNKGVVHKKLVKE